ncbi:hypothetical protein KW800_02045 [Candidatus Parcubacteria bacterium]|nr:hypothetical protein [Candidatus Parcubacteria bacterium]
MQSQLRTSLAIGILGGILGQQLGSWFTSILTKDRLSDQPALQAANDSLRAFRTIEEFPDPRLAAMRDSVSRGLLAMVQHTYPLPAQRVRWVVFERPNKGYDGRFYGTTIGVVPSAFTGYKNPAASLGDVLSHEVGHALSPEHLSWVALSEPNVFKMYGPDHLNRLSEFDDRFRSAYHHANSIVHSHGTYLEREYAALLEGKQKEKEFFDQYMAEMLGCYLGGCPTRDETLSEEEERLAEEYITYINRGPFDRVTTAWWRAYSISTMSGYLRELATSRVH